jgi:protein-S-isoprenylcysteine O-methyltransferase Ste14
MQIALIWVLWGFLHSFLTCRWWTNRLSSLVGKRLFSGWYRTFFVFISLGTLMPVLFYQYSLEQRILFSWPRWWFAVQGVLYMYGLYMFYAGLKRYDILFFVGIRQLKAYLSGAAIPRAVFTSDGIGGVRHPWYSGGIALVWAFGPITDVSLASKIVISCYFIIGAFLEERKLMADIGRPYEEYRRRLPMLFPWRRVRE